MCEAQRISVQSKEQSDTTRTRRKGKKSLFLVSVYYQLVSISSDSKFELPISTKNYQIGRFLTYSFYYQYLPKPNELVERFIYYQYYFNW